MLQEAKEFDVELAVMMDVSAACGNQVIYFGNRLVIKTRFTRSERGWLQRCCIGMKSKLSVSGIIVHWKFYFQKLIPATVLMKKPLIKMKVNGT